MVAPIQHRKVWVRKGLIPSMTEFPQINKIKFDFCFIKIIIKGEISFCGAP